MTLSLDPRGRPSIDLFGKKLLEIPPIGSPTAGVFWRPNALFLDELASELQGLRVLEVFAGNGLLAAYLAQAGIDVLATSTFSSYDSSEKGFYYRVEERDAKSAVSEFYGDRDALLMCWPTVTTDAYLAAAAWTLLRPEAPIIFIGEITDRSMNQLSGCATDEFHERFEIHKRLHSYRGNIMEHAVIGVMGLPQDGWTVPGSLDSR